MGVYLQGAPGPCEAGAQDTDAVQLDGKGGIIHTRTHTHTPGPGPGIHCHVGHVFLVERDGDERRHERW